MSTEAVVDGSRLRAVPLSSMVNGATAIGWNSDSRTFSELVNKRASSREGKQRT